MTSLSEIVEVRRANGTCGYGEWVRVTHDDVPWALVEELTDVIFGAERRCGEVKVGGQEWEWRTRRDEETSSAAWPEPNPDEIDYDLDPDGDEDEDEDDDSARF